MEDDVIQAGHWMLGKLHVQPDAPGLRVARTPTRLHIFRLPFRAEEPGTLFPDGETPLSLILELLAIPFAHMSLALFGAAASTYGKDGVLPSDIHGVAPAFDNGEEALLSPDVHGLACHAFALCLALLAGDIRLLLAYPRKLRSDEAINRGIANGIRRRKNHSPVRRLHAQMHVLDVFAGDLNGDI